MATHPMPPSFIDYNRVCRRGCNIIGSSLFQFPPSPPPHRPCPLLPPPRLFLFLARASRGSKAQLSNRGGGNHAQSRRGVRKRGPRDSPRALPGAQDCLQTAQEAPKTPQEGSRRPSSRARGSRNQLTFLWFLKDFEIPACSGFRPPKTAHEAPKRPPRRPKRPPRGPPGRPEGAKLIDVL